MLHLLNFHLFMRGHHSIAFVFVLVLREWNPLMLAASPSGIVSLQPCLIENRPESNALFMTFHLIIRTIPRVLLTCEGREIVHFM